MAALSLKAYGAGLVGHMLVKVLAPGYFARQDMKTPVRIGIISLICNMVFNLILIQWLGHVGLALATSLSAFLNAFLLWRGLLQAKVYWFAQYWVLFLLRLGLALMVMAAFLNIVVPDSTAWLTMTVWLQIGWMSGLCLGGSLLYFLVLFMTGLRFSDFRDS